MAFLLRLTAYKSHGENGRVQTPQPVVKSDIFVTNPNFYYILCLYDAGGIKKRRANHRRKSADIPSATTPIKERTVKHLLWIIALLAACAGAHHPLHAQELYFEAKVTSGPISESIGGFYSKFAEKSGYTTTRWNVIGVSDFNRDKIPDVLYHTVSSGYRGAYSDRLTLEKGVLNERNVSWKEWNASTPPPGADAVIGDFNSDGWDDVALSLGSGRDYDARVAVFSNESCSITRMQFNEYPYSYYLSPSYLGDFNGDGLLDLFRNDSVFIGMDNFNFEYHPNAVASNKGAFFRDFDTNLCLDLNRDGCDDLLYWKDSAITVVYGGPAEEIFSVTQSYNVPIQPSEFRTVSVPGIDTPSAYIRSSTEFLWITADRNGALSFNPLVLKGGSQLRRLSFGDINGDVFIDMLSWNENRLSIYLGESDCVFQHATDIELPYVREIKSAFVRDADLNGQNDLLVFSEDGDMITLYRRDAPPPTPTPTQTPFPPTPIQPTPTPLSLASDSMIVESTMSLEEMIASAPDGTVFYLEPGEYFSGDSPKIQSKKISLLGIDPQNRARIMRSIHFNDSSIRIQNLIFDAFLVAPFSSRIVIRNTDLKITNCFVRGPMLYSSAIGGPSMDAEPAFPIYNSVDKTILFKDNEIEAGDSGVNILVQNSQNTTLDLRENPMLGIDNRIAHVQIVDSTNVTVLLRDVDNPYYPRSLTTLTVSRSTVNVIGGVIRGYDGLPDVVGENGGYGIRANEGSTVTLQNVEVAGGRGGDGIEPGRNGPATLVDETSTVLCESAVAGWMLH